MSTRVPIGSGCPIGATPPIAWPVCRRTNSGVARRSAGTPRRAATVVSSTRGAPLVSTSSGLPPMSNTRLLAIASRATPSWVAAAAAVRALSGRWRTVPVAPAARSSRATSATRGCSGGVGAVGGMEPILPPASTACRRGPSANVARHGSPRLDGRGTVRCTGSVRTGVRAAPLLHRSPALPRPERWRGAARGCARGGESVMSRVLGEVAGRVGEEVQVERGPLGPVQFWRGQSRYLVGELLDSWVETAPWWRRDAAVGGASAELVATQEVWRVEAVRAGRSRTSFAGVYDLSWDGA